MYGEWGPTPVLSINGYKYFITFIDDFSDYTWVYLFNTHANVLQIFHDFVMIVENKLSMTIKLLLSDSAREYMLNQKKILIVCQTNSTPFLKVKEQNLNVLAPTPLEQNGIEEKKEPVIFLPPSKLFLILLFHPYIGRSLSILQSTVYLINRQFTSVSNGCTLIFVFSTLTLVILCYKRLDARVICSCSLTRTKLTSQTDQCVFFGYVNTQKGLHAIILFKKKNLTSHAMLYLLNIFQF